MPISARITGDKELQAKLQRLAQFARGGPKAQQTMKKSVLYVHSQVPGYPAPPAGSTYRRTGTLGRSVTTLAGGNVHALSRIEGGPPVRGIVGTRLGYAGYVIDRLRQAWMHKGRWWTLQDVVQKSSGGIRKIWEAALKELINA